MLLADLDQVDAKLLSRLCEEKCPESDTLDFKRELPGSAERDKHELLKDVASFANADGGDLVYGVADSDGHAEALAPICEESVDEATRRVQQVLDAGLEPRVQGLRFRAVSLDGGFALIVRVPASFSGPHSIRVNTNRRFVIRNGTTTSDLTMDQLRAAFDRSSSLASRAQDFVSSRLRVIGGDPPTPPKAIARGPTLTAHFVPMAGLAGRHGLDVQEVERNSFTRFLFHEWGGGSRSFNLDGLVVHPPPTRDGIHDGYCQLFRNGTIESVTTIGTTWTPPSGGPPKKLIPSRSMSEYVRTQVGTMLSASKDYGFAGPAVLSVALLNVRGYELGVDDMFRRREPVADRGDMVLPPVWLSELTIADQDGIVRPMLDTLWQAFGMSNCWDYDPKSGSFLPYRR